MPYGVDACMDPVKTPGTEPPADCVRPDAQANKLVPRDDSVLAPGQLGNRLLHTARPQKGADIALFCGLGGHPARVAGNLACVAR